jgi:hypothetical protein
MARDAQVRAAGPPGLAPSILITRGTGCARTPFAPPVIVPWRFAAKPLVAQNSRFGKPLPRRLKSRTRAKALRQLDFLTASRRRLLFPRAHIRLVWLCRLSLGLGSAPRPLFLAGPAARDSSVTLPFAALVVRSLFSTTFTGPRTTSLRSARSASRIGSPQSPSRLGTRAGKPPPTLRVHAGADSWYNRSASLCGGQLLMPIACLDRR